MKNKLVSIVAAASLAMTSFASLATTASAAVFPGLQSTLDLSDIGVTFTPGQNSYGETIYSATNGQVLTGTLNYNCKIYIPAGATVTLRDVTIDGTSWADSKWAGITIGDGTNSDSATIILEGSNTVKGFNSHYPGIYVSEGKTLYIQGEGSLDVSGGEFGSGIGSAYDFDNDIAIPGGNIVIESGTINAKGGNYGAGIGTCTSSSCGDITITGGTVNAEGGEFGAGIGSGAAGTCGNILITGGTVTATGGDGAVGIGSGVTGTCGNITITDGVTSVTAVKGGSRDSEGLEVVPDCIGASSQEMYDEATVGTITIGGADVSTSESPFTYTPEKRPTVTGEVTETAANNEGYNSDGTKDNGATAFITTLTKSGEGDVTVSSVTWEITSNGETKSFTASDELPNITFDSNSTAVIALAVDGLYDQDAAADVTVE